LASVFWIICLNLWPTSPKGDSFEASTCVHVALVSKGHSFEASTCVHVDDDTRGLRLSPIHTRHLPVSTYLLSNRYSLVRATR
jgi:hypothetical protein